jgi:hypothetical protein
VIEDFVQKQSECVVPGKAKKGRSIFLSYDVSESFRMLPKIADFVLAPPGDRAGLSTHRVRPPLYGAPEVLLRIGWSYKIDFWSLVVLVGAPASTVHTSRDQEEAK